MFRRRVLLVAAAAAIVSGCATMSSPVSVADTIAANPSLSTLNGLIVKAGLTPTLKGAGPFTVFAPTNDAFKAVPAKTMDDLAKNPAMLKDVLTYHVISAKVMSADVKNGPVKTVNGANVAVAKAGDFVTVEDSMVQTANIVATNGVVHTVDRVMIPPKKN
ncbi:MAG: fasciclin domain-containing protein [Polaromonas sp.]|uniref:fasciclin domain-containing protein n=1 Tax=Polaromonas sp. TaxID=1869339 RepID=UPI002730BBEE|nr:fasciclin domain-containing protein [Polaromonas sp.]MDP1740905.1 fasciclin domain-containing protein [Polaromonas sp.]MDP3357556.1 fasciclin domain-containing protein [Polaromonas sp.]